MATPIAALVTPCLEDDQMYKKRGKQVDLEYLPSNGVDASNSIANRDEVGRQSVLNFFEMNFVTGGCGGKSNASENFVPKREARK